MNLQPHNTDSFVPPRPPAVRMTEDEAQAVIRLWQQEQTGLGGLTNRPSLKTWPKA